MSRLGIVTSNRYAAVDSFKKNASIVIIQLKHLKKSFRRVVVFKKLWKLCTGTSVNKPYAT